MKRGRLPDIGLVLGQYFFLFILYPQQPIESACLVSAAVSLWMAFGGDWGYSCACHSTTAVVMFIAHVGLPVLKMRLLLFEFNFICF